MIRAGERNVMYERVIREATRAEDLHSYLNEDVLRQVWAGYSCRLVSGGSGKIVFPTGGSPRRHGSIFDMDPFHEQLARIALDAAGSFGFALAGGYAVQAHGFLNRQSSDIDLFAEASAAFDFTQALDVVIAAYLREGLQVETRKPSC
jgi:hypothetical protein